MQHKNADGIVICCDFCRTDWDQVKPMIEGHRGSVVCLACLKLALEQASAEEGEFSCTLCVRQNLPPSLVRWTNPRHPQAVVCSDCIDQAAKAFDKDSEVAWSRPEAEDRGKTRED